MSVGVVDIGTNSMRLLIADGTTEIHREVIVTGLGAGVDETGRFRAERVEATLAVLEAYGATMTSAGVDHRRAVATSATRDASDGPAFVDRAAHALGVRPQVITGSEEAALSFRGATAAVPSSEPAVVIDIGGGSTEFVYGRDAVSYSTSVDVGTVRLTERMPPLRPVGATERADAAFVAAAAFESVALPGLPTHAIGVGGAFTSLSAIAMNLAVYDRDRVHGSTLGIGQLSKLIERLGALTLAETEAIPSLDPRRAPVIFAAALIADAALRAVNAEAVTVSESDLLDGVALQVAADHR